eukprot:14024945-Heterocapsa_arctica.AAC.1
MTRPLLGRRTTIRKERKKGITVSTAPRQGSTARAISRSGWKVAGNVGCVASTQPRTWGGGIWSEPTLASGRKPVGSDGNKVSI